MVETEDLLGDFLLIKVVQGGKVEHIELGEQILVKKFREVLFPLFKKYKIKKRDAMLTTEDGRMLYPLDYNLTVENLIEKFGKNLKLYDEKQI